MFWSENGLLHVKSFLHTEKLLYIEMLVPGNLDSNIYECGVIS